MDHKKVLGGTATRRPLGDATKRLSNASLASSNRQYYADDSASLRSKPSKRIPRDPNNPFPPSDPEIVIKQERHQSATAPTIYENGPVAMHNRLRIQDKNDDSAEKRVSQFSNVSSTASTTRQLKTHIGPWQLGKTLSKGSSARVRLARHRVNHQLAAIKIVTKESAKITQAGSLANLDRVYEKQKLSVQEGYRRMPVAIEREVAILKLIEHPNIMKLHDIWENRSEIYLVTEYVEKGDMFDFINWQGRMSEEECMYYFRQIMRAMEYIHSFHICHRDLKPENILLKADGTVKIADFGMAALRQSPDRPLTTACGSPHYAAPELLRNQGYMGPEVDIWSMGVILFAMLAGRLPFDESNIHVMLAKSKNADYEMSSHLTSEAQDVVRRILVPNPRRRLTMRQMWQTALLKKYDYLDEFINEGKTMPVREEIEIEAIPNDAIDPQILRQLKALWHASSEKELRVKLTEDQANEHKTFYWLLYKYRETQMENYNNDLPISKSDFHHLKPPNWGKRISTCEFVRPRHKNQHHQTVSRFSVISNVPAGSARSEFGTVKSYDPYNASRVLRPVDLQASRARIVVHRPSSAEQDARRPSTRRPSSRRTRHSRSGSLRKRRDSVQTYMSDNDGTGRVQSPRSSFSSLRSSRLSTPQVRVSSRHRRGVDFSSLRGRAGREGSRPSSVQSSRGEASAPAGHAGVSLAYSAFPKQARARAPSPSSSRPKSRYYNRAAATPSLANSKDDVDRDDSVIWNEELMELSHTIAKDCDEAFQSSILLTDSEAGDARQRQSTPYSITMGALTPMQSQRTSVRADETDKHRNGRWDDRPLPPVPPSMTAASAGDRRIVSAPVYRQADREMQQLPPISENARETNKARVVSAPTNHAGKLSDSKAKQLGLSFLGGADNTIRVVQSSTGPARDESLVKVPQPLAIRKQHSRGVSEAPIASNNAPISRFSLHKQGTKARELAHDERRVSQKSKGAKRKVSSWFKRTSKDDLANAVAMGTTIVTETAHDEKAPTVHTARIVQIPPRASSRQSHSDAVAIPQPAKKRHFSLSFWKGSKDEMRMSLAGEMMRHEELVHNETRLTVSLSSGSGPEYSDTPSPEPKPVADRAYGKTKPSKSVPGRSNRGADFWQDGSELTRVGSERQIAVQQNWLARLFRVKPATRYLCLAISKRRARQEIAILLREWRRYGIKDIEVDKTRNIVFARVGLKNYLGMKEVSFAAEIMTVIEHGRRSHLCIVRFTQEKGAASSFHKVIDTMDAVFRNRGLGVSDKRKAKMMIKTLQS